MTCTIRSTALGDSCSHLGSGLALAPREMPRRQRRSADDAQRAAEQGGHLHRGRRGRRAPGNTRPASTQSRIKSGATGVVIEGASISSGDYSFTGVVATGEKSVVTLNHVTMKLGVTKEAGTKGRMAGATLRGRVEVDGRPVMPVAGEASGRITVTPL